MPDHFKVDIRFENKERNVVVLIETKQNFVESDKEQLRQYVDEEKVLFLPRKNENEIAKRSGYLMQSIISFTTWISTMWQSVLQRECSEQLLMFC